MSRCLLAIGFTWLCMTGISVAAELAPMDGHSIRIDRFDGSVYYTVEQDGYRVVATLAAGAEGVPVRLISTLMPGQRMVISVPQPAGQASVDFEIARKGDLLLVSDPIASAKADQEALIPAALRK